MKAPVAAKSYSRAYREIFQSYGLDILKIEKEEYLSGRHFQCRLPFENETEYRVTLGHIFSMEDVEDWHNCTTVEEHLKKYPTSPTDDLEKDLKRIGEIEKIQDERLEFSFFLPKGAKVDKKDNKELFHLAAWGSAAVYMTILKNSIDNTYDGHIHDADEIYHEERLGVFLELIGAKISNRNVNDLTGYAYRLYKDSKFFYELQTHISDKYGKTSYDNLIQELLNVK